MKTLQEFYDELVANEAMQKELMEAATSKEAVTAFLRKYDCDADFDAYKAFMNETHKTDKKLRDTELELAAGGNWTTIAASVLMVANCIICSVLIQTTTDDDCTDMITD